VALLLCGVFLDSTRLSRMRLSLTASGLALWIAAERFAPWALVSGATAASLGKAVAVLSLPAQRRRATRVATCALVVALSLLGWASASRTRPLAERARPTWMSAASWGLDSGFDLEGLALTALLWAQLARCALRAARLALTFAATAPISLFLRPLSHVVPRFSYDRRKFFRADACPESVALKRERAYDAMCAAWSARWAKSAEMSSRLRRGFSDLRFAAGNRVFLPFAALLQAPGSLDPCTVVERTERMHLVDVDGCRLMDVAGSYGVNVCGNELYKRFMARAAERVKDVGCVLGPLHPIVLDNIERLRRACGMPDAECSFHMSGTEAVMCAVRVARFNTGRRLVVVFGGAYHGWWDGVQTSAGGQRDSFDTLTLKDASPASLAVIRERSNEIAAVLVNPLQAFHLNKPPPSDLTLASDTRCCAEDVEHSGYRAWLGRLKRACRDAGAVLVFDEVYTGFRLAPGGAQAYWGVEADLVCYGKTLGGGLPVGVVCGPPHLMNRTDPARPMRVAYVVGTFSAHPMVMASMNEFLRWVDTDEAKRSYAEAEGRVKAWTRETNARLEKEQLPLRLACYATVWTMLFQSAGRYHWMLQYYLRDEGVALSWVGTGRLNFSLDFGDGDLAELRERLVRACRRMQEDGWWFEDGDGEAGRARAAARGRAIKLGLVHDVLGALGRSLLA
jgi:glutamate-1-semialdehyde 2,1-aminomutase